MCDLYFEQFRAALLADGFTLVTVLVGDDADIDVYIKYCANYFCMAWASDDYKDDDGEIYVSMKEFVQLYPEMRGGDFYYIYPYSRLPCVEMSIK